jgi:hypothetical protein
MFYKLDGNNFANRYSVHTYPTVVYVDKEPNNGAQKRLVGPMITDNSLDQFIMECVETGTGLEVSDVE